jgi:L-serine deaminase
MLFKRGSTISAAEGGCQAEVGGEYCNTNFVMCIHRASIPTVACSMAGAGFAACMGGILLSLGDLRPV